MNEKYLLSTTNRLDRSEGKFNNPSQDIRPQTDFLDSRSEAERELFQALCFNEAQTYPWSLLTGDSQRYFAELEASTASLTDRSSEEVAAGAQIFLAHLDILWDAATTSDNLLEDQFANLIPASLIKTLKHQVKLLQDSSVTLAEQLVQCTYEVMPQWAVEDLQVLARPFAYAMRGTEADAAIEAILDKVAGNHWTDLSEIEQVRLCLAYTRYTLANLD
ncbi:MAG: hypothetical protein AB4352_17175 [Hormoscilla sp.]